MTGKEYMDCIYDERDVCRRIDAISRMYGQPVYHCIACGHYFKLANGIPEDITKEIEAMK